MGVSLPQFRNSRLEIRPARLGFPEIEEVGRINYIRAFAPLPAHRHPGAIEIYYLVRGQQTYAAGGRSFSLRGGDLFFTRPGEQHGTEGRPREKTLLYWVRINLTRRATWLALPPREARGLCQALLKVTRRPIRTAEPFKKIFDTMFLAFFDARLPHQKTVFRIKVLDLLLSFLLSVREQGASRERRVLPELLGFIDARIGQPLSVGELARKSGYSPSWLKALFKREIGVPPREYVLRRKIEVARVRLTEGGRSVTDVAFDLGFPSSQYFATVFKRLTGFTPREIRPRAI